MIGVTFVFLIYIFFMQNTPIPTNQTETSKQQWETKTDDQPPVTVKVTPVELGKDAQTWKFDIAFDTHSGSLDQDPIKVISLSDDKGNSYQPIIWEGSGPGGHHREGALIFNSIQPAPKYVELKIKDVSGIDERTFRWNLGEKT